MKVLFVLGRYLLEKNGGIENYTHTLAMLLSENGHCVDVAILHGNDMQPFIYEKINVTPLKKGFESFSHLIQKNNYDVCHFQEYSAFGGIEMFWFNEAKQYCRKVFFTFHLPYFTCYKNDFRYYGVEDCNNFSLPERCVKCIIATRLGYKKSDLSPKNLFIDWVTPLIGSTTKIHRLHERVQNRVLQLEEIITICDFIFIYANWFMDLLIKNGYYSPTIKKIPYITNSVSIANSDYIHSLKRKILFVGRIEKQKGLILLCKAMNLIRSQNIELEVYGNIVDEKYNSKCRREFAYHFKGTVPLSELLQNLSGYDFLILPSAFTEMYSMILKDALNLGVPVIASSAKGNKDAIIEGKNGFLFKYNDYKDLAKVIDMAYNAKTNGWQAELDKNNNYQNDLQEILSYYNVP